MYVKKHSTNNEYIHAGGVWVRNFTKDGVTPVLLEHMFEKSEYENVLINEFRHANLPRIAEERIRLPLIAIVSDGYDFEKRHKVLLNIPGVAVLAVNRAMRRWQLMPEKPINAYVINNPFPEAMTFLPTKDSLYFPTCITSTRTYYPFSERYVGDKYVYEPTATETFGIVRNSSYSIDDYRNPICAAIDLAFHWGVQKLMLLCCDDSFSQRRDFATELPNGLWTYPQHIKAMHIIDAKLHWLTHYNSREIEVANYSSGIEYVNSKYINNDEEALSFFHDNTEGNYEPTAAVDS